MTTQISPATLYVDTINAHDPAAFIALFDDHAIVNDAGREFRGVAAIKTWSEHDIFDVHVTLEPVNSEVDDDETLITTKVDGNFDKTGLPDPLFIAHHIKIEDGKIVQLTCRLAENKSDS